MITYNYQNRQLLNVFTLDVDNYPLYKERKQVIIRNYF